MAPRRWARVIGNRALRWIEVTLAVLSFVTPHQQQLLPGLHPPSVKALPISAAASGLSGHTEIKQRTKTDTLPRRGTQQSRHPEQLDRVGGVCADYVLPARIRSHLHGVVVCRDHGRGEHTPPPVVTVAAEVAVGEHERADVERLEGVEPAAVQRGVAGARVVALGHVECAQPGEVCAWFAAPAP